MALPPGEGPFPALVVIHEWWGLNDNIREEADGFAENGYAALAVDLYEGTVADSPDAARAAMRKVEPESALANLDAAVTYLQSHPFVSRDRVGSIGWCFGGAQSLNLAIHNPEPRRRGHLLRPSQDRSGDPQNDRLSHPRTSSASWIGASRSARVREFEKGLKKANVSHEIHVYGKADHAFANPHRNALQRGGGQKSLVPNREVSGREPEEGQAIEGEGMLLVTILKLYSYVLIIRVILSWVNPNPFNPLVRIFYVLTEPVLAPIRRVLPSMGGLDLSPIVVFIAISLLIRMLF